MFRGPSDFHGLSVDSRREMLTDTSTPSVHRQQDRSASVCSSDYSVVPSSTPFSALHVLRNYQLFGSGSAVAAVAAAASAVAADFVTNPHYELLYPHRPNMRPVSSTYCEYISEGCKRDSAPAISLSKRILLAEDSASSSSPPPPQRAPVSTPSMTSLNPSISSSGGLQRQQTFSFDSASLPATNSLVSVIHQPAAINNTAQQFSDSTSFPENGIDRSRRFFAGDAPNVPGCRSRRPRSEKRPIPDDQKDDRYYERRKRNNQAAKKSRDARKIREDHIALKATMLEHENAILRTQILGLREEAQSLRRMLIEQQMPKLHGRYVIDCPRSTLTSPSSGSGLTIGSTAPDSSPSRTILFPHPTTKISTALLS